MKSINFNEGYKNYAVNGDESRVISIRIADVNLMDRANRALSEIDGLKAKYGGKITSSQAVEFDKELREIVNNAFGTDICTSAFGTANVCTPVGDGEMLFTAFFDAFMPLLEADIKALDLTKKTDQPTIRPEVEKYLDKTPVVGLANPYGNTLPDVSGLTPEQKRALVAQLLA